MYQASRSLSFLHPSSFVSLPLPRPFLPRAGGSKQRNHYLLSFCQRCVFVCPDLQQYTLNRLQITANRCRRAEFKYSSWTRWAAGRGSEEWSWWSARYWDKREGRENAPRLILFIDFYLFYLFLTWNLCSVCFHYMLLIPVFLHLQSDVRKIIKITRQNNVKALQNRNICVSKLLLYIFRVQSTAN